MNSTVYIDDMFEYHRERPGGTTQNNNRLHIMDNEKRIAMRRIGSPFPGDTGPAIQYHLGDHLGSSHLVVDVTGAWTNREEFTPFGETSFGSFAKKRYRFTGKERDEFSGLYYHGARYYAPWLTKWISCDPIVFNEDSKSDKRTIYLNLYLYAFANPFRFTDPNGKENIIAIGSQHDSGSANKLMFVHQGLRQLRDYNSTESAETRTVLLFREGYSQAQIDAVLTEVESLGGHFVVVDSVNDMIDYINTGVSSVGTTGQLNTTTEQNVRSSDPVSNLDMFSHGIPGAVEFGYSTRQQTAYRLDATAAGRLNPLAFGSDSNSGIDRITSYACRTALVGPNQSVSLAQSISNAAGFRVDAYRRRTDYSGTLGTRADRRHSCTFFCDPSDYSPALTASMARRRNIDGATFDPNGAMHPVTAGDTPSDESARIQTFSP
ncbi:MAG: RHS repeat-associated core domain-containing protein [Candidatus Thiodiazotropha sp.]